MTPVTIVLLCGPSGPGSLERLVAAARREAAADSLVFFQRLPTIDRLIVALPESEQAHFHLPDSSATIIDLDPIGQPFHFGNRLAEIIHTHQLNRILYLGAGSLPLMSESALAEIVTQIVQADGRAALTNNLHSSDWVAFTQAHNIQAIAGWLDRDNMLAWRLRENAGYTVETLLPSAGTRLDIDTPFDLQALALHPRTLPHLRSYLANLEPELNLARLKHALEILRAPTARLTLIGRVASAAWQLLESKKRYWTRLFSEERGMVANRRQADGQAYSLLADYLDRIGPQDFVAQLARTSDLVLWDTRVYLAHHGRWPSAEERFASDLGYTEQITDERLKRLTQAVSESPIPILLGGHNVVSGGLYALLEIAS